MEGKPSFAYVSVALLLIWLGLTYSPSMPTEMFLQEFVVGAAVAVVIALLTSKNFTGMGLRYFHPRRVAYFIAFFIVFIKEMIKANLNMARIVLSPSLPVKPGIVEIETELKHGTMTLDYRDDKAYIHWVDVKSEDPKEAGDIIKGGFEKLLRGVFS